MFYTHDKVGLPECPYMERWILNFGVFTIRLHHWISSDDQRHLHDHPFWFVTMILKGAYVDISPTKSELLERGAIRFRKATHQHTVSVSPDECWTLLLTGREKREWGFWVDGRFRKRNRYFFDYKHHPCE